MNVNVDDIIKLQCLRFVTYYFGTDVIFEYCMLKRLLLLGSTQYLLTDKRYSVSSLNLILRKTADAITCGTRCIMFFVWWATCDSAWVSRKNIISTFSRIECYAPILCPFCYFIQEWFYTIGDLCVSCWVSLKYRYDRTQKELEMRKKYNDIRCGKGR